MLKKLLSWSLVLILTKQAYCFWDMGTTTATIIREDTTPRQSFFRWQIVHSEWIAWWFTNWDWNTIRMNRKLAVICGLSIDFLPLGTGALLNQRAILSSANFLEPYMHRQKDVRIWAVGRAGYHTTPYRYRVWRVRRVLPKSMNPEHWHGPRGVHVPRHDITMIHSFDQMYIYSVRSIRWFYAQRVMLAHKHQRLGENLWFAGSGFEYIEHINENYKIFYANQTRDEIVDCSKYLPKWWGKFICIINSNNYAGVPNGGGLFINSHEDLMVGVGCFDIRYNDDRILVFTDIRYYMDLIETFANISWGEYYEYAYPHWGLKNPVWHGMADNMWNNPYLPHWQIKYVGKPYGKR